MIARPSHRRLIAIATAVAAVATAAGCGSSTTGSGGNANPATGSSGASTSAKATGSAKVDPTTGIINAKYCHNTTDGVTSSTIKFGLSHPESGPSAITAKSAIGVKAYFDYANAELGGIKGHQLELVTKDDGAQAARTVQNVNQMLEQDHVFGFVLNQGTPNNLAIRDRLDAQCVPNLLLSTGSPKLASPIKHPFTLIANATYAAEVNAFVDYVAKVAPGAKIATISENSDFGKSYTVPMVKAAAKKGLTIATQQTYEPTDPNVTSQFTGIRGSKATALFIGAAALKCSQSLDAVAHAFKVIYLSANCTAKGIVSLAKPENTQGVLSESALMDPTNPANASNPNMKLYFAKMKKYAPKDDATQSTTSYGWTEAAILYDILKASPKLDRVDVMNTANHLTLPDNPGLLQAGVVWKTDTPSDDFPVESFRLQSWDSTAHRFTPMPDLISYEGQSAQFAG